MQLNETLVAWMAAGVIALPFVAFGVIGTSIFLFDTRKEGVTSFIVLAAHAASNLLSAAVALSLLWFRLPRVAFELGKWFPSGEYAFELDLLVDGLSATMSLLVATISGLTARFSVHYLHRERGFHRFFALLSLFSAGMQLLVLSGSVDLLFAGWELVGLSSVLLVAFFYERRTPVAASLRVLLSYRLCDVGLLVGAVLLHQEAHTTEFVLAIPRLTANHGHASMLTIIMLCMLVATMGKSALLPVGNWLPRAMEGPTPSSALFYGALSVHAGVYLMLRLNPLLMQSKVASGAVIAVGLLTAVGGTLAGHVQTDIKSALAYATMAQVGLMFVECGFGLTTLALIHLGAHASLRAFQLLRAPSALRDIQQLRAASVGRGGARPWYARSGYAWTRVYRAAVERFYFDILFERWLIEPVRRFGIWVDAIERRWLDVLSGVPSFSTRIRRALRYARRQTRGLERRS